MFGRRGVGQAPKPGGLEAKSGPETTTARASDGEAKAMTPEAGDFTPSAQRPGPPAVSSRQAGQIGPNRLKVPQPTASAGTTAARPASPGALFTLKPQAAGQRTLVVGSGITVRGAIEGAEFLVVEGVVEAQLSAATDLSISVGGVFKGEVEVDNCDVAGTLDGTITARSTLIVRSTGCINGSARCRRLQVEDGGQISGHIEMLGGTMAASVGVAT